MQALPIIMTIASTAIAAQQASQTNKERQQAVNAMYAKNAATTNEVTTSVEDQAAKQIDPYKQAERASGAQQDIQAGLGSSLQAALQPNSSDVPVGKVSPDYQARLSQRTAEEAKRIGDSIKLYAATNAPSTERFYSALEGNQKATERGTAAADNADYQRLAQANYGSIQPNPWVSAAGSALGSAGSALSNYNTTQSIQNIFKPTTTNPYALYGHT